MAAQVPAPEEVTSSHSRVFTQRHNVPSADPVRRDTGSTVSSGNEIPAPIPPGFYTLPISGNCPKCHHRHVEATIRLRVPFNTNHATYVDCDSCHERWLAIGAGGSTLSLLSTKTLEPDAVEQDFRRALLNIIRSVTSIGSTTALASVPEVPSRVPSREHSTRSRHEDESLNVQSSSTAGAVAVPAPMGRHQVNPSIRKTLKTRETRDFLRHVTVKLKQGFRGWRRFRPVLSVPGTAEISTSRGPHRNPSILAAERADGVIQAVYPTRVDGNVERAADTHEPHIRGTDPPAPFRTFTPPCIPIDIPDKERLSAMTSQQRVVQFQAQFVEFKEQLRDANRETRINWVRQQYSDFKLQYAAKQRRQSTHTNFVLSHSDSGVRMEEGLPPPQPPPRSPPQRAQRRHSDDLRLIGSHLPPFFDHGEFFYQSRPFSIGSTTRLSGTTNVNSDSLTVTSGVSSLDIRPSTQRQPRPRSVQSRWSRYRNLLGSDDVVGRPSMESATSTGAVRSHAGFQFPMERRSTGSILMPYQTSTGDAQSATASIAYMNGYRTSEEMRRENNRRSSSAIPSL